MVKKLADSPVNFVRGSGVLHAKSGQRSMLHTKLGSQFSDRQGSF
jgi:hypothetical protein